MMTLEDALKVCEVLNETSARSRKKLLAKVRGNFSEFTWIYDDDYGFIVTAPPLKSMHIDDKHKAFDHAEERVS